MNIFYKRLGTSRLKSQKNIFRVAFEQTLFLKQKKKTHLQIAQNGVENGSEEVLIHIY